MRLQGGREKKYREKYKTVQIPQQRQRLEAAYTLGSFARNNDNRHIGRGGAYVFRGRVSTREVRFLSAVCRRCRCNAFFLPFLFNNLF